MPGALSARLFSPASRCQFLSTTPLGVTLPVTAHIAPPLQLDKVNTAITPTALRYLHYQQCRFQRLEQALLCHCLPIPIRTFFFFLFLPRQFSTNTMGGPDNSFKKARLRHSAGPPPSPSPTQSILSPPPFHHFLHHHPLWAPLSPPPAKTALSEGNRRLQEGSSKPLTSYHADCSLC